MNLSSYYCCATVTACGKRNELGRMKEFRRHDCLSGLFDAHTQYGQAQQEAMVENKSSNMSTNAVVGAV